jgi:hypothetical protein
LYKRTVQLATEVKYIVHGECGSHKQGLQGHVLENTGSQVNGDTLLFNMVRPVITYATTVQCPRVKYESRTRQSKLQRLAWKKMAAAVGVVLGLPHLCLKKRLRHRQ